MPWVVVWPVLVAAALVGGFLLGRDLWRRGRGLARAAGRAADAAGRFGARTDELAAEAAGRHRVPPVALLRDRDELRADVAAARAARDRRRDDRRARQRQVRAHWLDYWR